MQFFQYMDVATFVVIFLAILAVIVLLNNASKAIKEMTKPVTDLREDIDRINERLDRMDEKLLHDYQEMERARELDRLLLRSVKQLVQHEIDGNNIKEMVALQKDIDDYLVDHA